MTLKLSMSQQRMTVFWPGMTKDVEEMVSSCEKCMKYQSKQPIEPMQTHHVPLLPWQTVASDILKHKNPNLVVIDDYLKYIEALQLTGKASQDVIQGLNEIFSRHGYPQTLVTDNMPYNSREMRQYAYRCGMQIATVRLTYSQSNGHAKKALHIVKNMLRKGSNLHEGLMEYRNTPISNFP